MLSDITDFNNTVRFYFALCDVAADAVLSFSSVLIELLVPSLSVVKDSEPLLLFNLLIHGKITKAFIKFYACYPVSMVMPMIFRKYFIICLNRTSVP